MTCYILGAAPVGDVDWISRQLDKKEEDLLICADGGLHLAERLGLSPDWVVGDFDSIVPFSQGLFAENILRFPPQKDDTDLALAIEQGRKLGSTDFVVYGALGGRFDHSIGVVQLLAGMANRSGESMRVMGEDCILLCVKDGCVILKNFAPCNIFSPPRRRLSVFSLDPISQGVTITGAAYPLSNALLCYDRPLGVSNEIVEPVATVQVDCGRLLVVLEQG